MAKVITDNQHYKDIADAIRAKTESGDSYKPSEMADAIMAIEGGGEFDGELEPGFVTPTGQEFTAYPDGAGFSSVTVAGDYNLTPENIAEGITIYGVEGTLKIGASSTIPSEYESFVEHAKLLYTGDYANIAIVESNNILNVAFLMDDFKVLSYNESTTEFTAIGWLYCEYTKATQTWRVVNYTTEASTGTNYVKHIRYSSVYWEYNGKVIWPVGAVETVEGGLAIKFFDEFDDPIDIRSVRDGATVLAPVYTVKFWEDESGNVVTFPIVATQNAIFFANTETVAGEIYEHYNMDSGEYPYLYIRYGTSDGEIYLAFIKTVDDDWMRELMRGYAYVKGLDPVNDWAGFVEAMYAKITVSYNDATKLGDASYIMSNFDLTGHGTFTGTYIDLN